MRFSIFTLNIFAVLRFAFDVCRGNFLCGKFLIFYSFFLLKKGEKAVESAACDAKKFAGRQSRIAAFRCRKYSFEGK